MISKITLEAVGVGILTDEQLCEAIKHYRQLVDILKPHGEKYYLVRADAAMTLLTLEGYYDSRKSRKSQSLI